MLQWRERLYHFLFHLLYTFHLLLVLLGLVRSLSRIKRWVLWLQRISFHPEGKASRSLVGQAEFQILEKWGADSYSGQRRSCRTSIPNQKETAGGWEQDKGARLLGCPGGFPKPASESSGCLVRRRLDAVKNSESRLYSGDGGGEGQSGLVSPDPSGTPCWISGYLPCVLIQNLLHIFLKDHTFNQDRCKPSSPQ